MKRTVGLPCRYHAGVPVRPRDKRVVADKAHPPPLGFGTDPTLGVLGVSIEKGACENYRRTHLPQPGW
jgi:hypothetical protein